MDYINVDYLQLMREYNKDNRKDSSTINQNVYQTQFGSYQRSQERGNRSVVHVYGGIHIKYIMVTVIPLLIFACLFSYHEAVKQKQEKPFPHATITATACHYPQDIVFRWIMLPAGFCINICYFAIYRWIATTKKRIGYPGQTFPWIHPLAQFSVLGFYGAIATIDAMGTPFIHGLGAVVFFIVLFIVGFSATLIIRDMRSWQTSIMSRSSLLVKQLLILYLLGVTIYSLIGVIYEKVDQNDDDPYLVIIEWNLTLVCLVWLLSFITDWKHIFLTLKGDFAQTIKRIDIS